MKLFTYRNRQRLKKALIVLAIAAALLLLGLWVCFRYLERFIVYTPDRAVLVLPGEEAPADAVPTGDYDLVQLPNVTVETIAGQAQRPAAAEDIPQIDASAKAVAISGYYVTQEDLADPAGVLAAISADADCTTVVMEVKNCYGSYFYSSGLEGASTLSSLDTAAIDSLIASLSAKYRLVAVCPAFCDSTYALDHQPEGLPISGGALWMDWDGYYWLDPASETVQRHLIDLCSDLTDRGFDEVAFSHFTFPSSQNIVYSGNRDTAIAEAGELVVKTAQLLEMQVSFWDLSQSRPVVWPTEEGHLFFPAEDGSALTSVMRWLEADLAASQPETPEAPPEEAPEEEAPLPTIEGVDETGEPEPAPEPEPEPESVQPEPAAAPEDLLTKTLVFCTDSHDTRFKAYSTIRRLGEE